MEQKTSKKEIASPSALIKKLGKDPNISEQLRRAGEQEAFREKLKSQSQFKRLLAHHPETILQETRETISKLTHVIAQVLGQRGVQAEWFKDVTEGSPGAEIISAPLTYLHKAYEISKNLSPERDKLDALLSKDPVIIEANKVARLAELAKSGKIKNSDECDRIINTAQETEKNRKTHIVRKYELELLAVWGPELLLLRLRREVLALESAILFKLRGTVLQTIEELVKITEVPEAEELLQAARALQMQAAFEHRDDGKNPQTLEQVNQVRAVAEKEEQSYLGRLEQNEETIRQLVELEHDLLSLIPTLGAKAEWKPVHRPVQKTGFGSREGVKVKHRGRMARSQDR